MRQTLETLEAEGPVLYYSAGFIRSVAKCDPRICWHCLLCVTWVTDPICIDCWHG